MREKVQVVGADGRPIDTKNRNFPWGPIVIVFCLGMFFLGWSWRGAHDANHNQTERTSGSASGVTYIEWEKVKAETERARLEAEAKRDKIWNHRPILNPPHNPPPGIVKIGAFFYTVHWTSAGALEAWHAYALSDHEVREIWLNPKRNTELRDDMMHELLHCAKNIGSLGNRSTTDYDPEENVIQMTSPTLLSILYDNPKLEKWLMEPANAR